MAELFFRNDLIKNSPLILPQNIMVLVTHLDFLKEDSAISVLIKMKSQTSKMILASNFITALTPVVMDTLAGWVLEDLYSNGILNKKLVLDTFHFKSTVQTS